MPRIVITNPNRPPQSYRFQLHRKTVRLARGPDNHITIECGSISASHAVMERIQGGYQFRDLGSTNGTKLDGTPRQLIPLSSGLGVQLGDVALDFSLAADEQAILAGESPTPVRPPVTEAAKDGRPQAAVAEPGWQEQALRWNSSGSAAPRGGWRGLVRSSCSP